MVAVFANKKLGAFLVIEKRGEPPKSDALADAIGRALRGRGELERITVEGATAVREAIEQRAEHDQAGLVAAVIFANDATSAATLTWELVERDARAWFLARVLVVLGDDARLSSLPKRLLDALSFVALDERVSERIEAIIDAPRPIDLLASVYRSAIAKRSPDPLVALGDSAGAVVEVDVHELPAIARVGDGGRQPNLLWSRWASFGREFHVREAPSQPVHTAQSAKKHDS